MQQKFSFLFSASLLFAFGLRAQTQDSAMHLPDVFVESPRGLSASPGLKAISFDSTLMSMYRQTSVAELLANESTVFVKSYGLGSLASTSIRGGSASQTAILWNGFALTSIMNGQLDFSLIPVSVSNSLQLQYGGGSSLYGSGAMAGTVLLSSAPRLNQGKILSMRSSMGSFGTFRNNLELGISKQKIATSVKFYHAQAENDFEYINPYNQNKERQKNARLRNYGMIADSRILLAGQQSLHISAWWQQTKREVPSTLLQSLNQTSQEDRATRLTAEWQRAGAQASYFARAAWINEFLDYRDSIAQIYEISRTQQLISEIESKLRLGKGHSFNYGIHASHAIGKHNAYAGKESRTSTALFASYIYQSANNKLHGNIAMRQELVNATWSPLTYSAGAQYALLPRLWLKGNFAKVYRLPTFNDLYWQPGGNPELLPEEGLTYEGGALWRWTSKRIALETEWTAFSKNIDNWIMWLPDNNYWRPENIMNVWSRGMETGSKIKWQSGDWLFHLGLHTSYVRATNSKAKTANDNSVGKQLIYTPMYSGSARAGVQYKDWYMSYHHYYNGYRYTATDNSEYLEPNAVGSLHLAYKFSGWRIPLTATFDVNNIWNKDYQAVLNRPMPGRHYTLSLQCTFLQRKQSF